MGVCEVYGFLMALALTMSGQKVSSGETLCQPAPVCGKFDSAQNKPKLQINGVAPLQNLLEC